MKVFWMVLILLIVLTASVNAQVNPHGADVEDNDFAEFEELDDDDEDDGVIIKKPVSKAEPVEMDEDEDDGETEHEEKQPKVVMSKDAIVNEDAEEEVTVEDEDEFDYLQDEDEFENFDKHATVKGKGSEKPPELKITKVPLHLRTNWDSFYLEMVMLAGLGVYLLNFLTGKSKNGRLAQAWFNSHKELLEANFAIVGDDGQSKELNAGTGQFIKESENIYTLWCSGRVCCEGMLVELKLLKRQDLVHTIARMFKPASDQIIVKVTMDENEMDSYVLCLAKKRIVNKLQKEMYDLSTFCTEKKSAERLSLPSSFQMLSEIGEASSAVFDRQMILAVSKYEEMIEYIHISDQYAGIKPPEEDKPTKMPDTSKMLIFCFNVPGMGKATTRDMENMKVLMQMVFHCMDKIKKVKLNREAKLKADKNRQKAEEVFMKASHSQRMEAAQQRREEKRRQEKEKIMNETDPDKQRRLEKRDEKKDAKKKAPKMKMMKVKSM